MITSGSEIEIRDSPTDGISAVKFGHFSDTLLIVSSWDSSVYLYDAVENVSKAKFPFDSALLDCCFGYSSTLAFTGGLSRRVIELELNTVQSRVLGSHDEAVKCVIPCKETGNTINTDFLYGNCRTFILWIVG